MKVLITIGSMSERKFTRLFNIIDSLCQEGILNGDEVVAQVGFDNYQSQYYRCFDMVADEEFKEMIANSDLVISHAGTGTIISCLKMGKKVIIFPRLVEYNEHYDNHQLDLTNLFEKKGYVQSAKNKEELIKKIINLDNFVPERFISNNDRITSLIVSFIEGKRNE